jgi:hypothetical protein
VAGWCSGGLAVMLSRDSMQTKVDFGPESRSLCMLRPLWKI